MFKFSALKENIDSVIAAVAGFAIIFLFTRHGGIGLEPDGVVFFTSAENLAAHGRLTDFTHKAVVEFPALYPLLLSAIMLLTGLQPLLFAPVLNALLFALLVYLSGDIMEHFSYGSKWYKRALLACIVLSPGLLEVYSMLWTETIFIPLILLFMMAMHRYFKSYSRGSLIIAASIASLASITRYAGISIIGTGGILILLDANLPGKKKLANLLSYTVISPLLLAINLARNYFAGGTITGNRERSITSLAQNIHNAGTVLYDWLPFFNGHYTGAGWLAAFLLGILMVFCIKQFSDSRRLVSYQNIATAFSLIYLLFMLVTASLSRFESLNSRFLSPAFIPLLLSCSSEMVLLFKRAGHIEKKWLIVAGIIIFLSFQYGQITADYETWDGVKDAGIPGYTEDQWKYSETVLFIQKDSLPFKKGYTVWSDASDAVYFFTGRSSRFLPAKEYKPGVADFLHDRHCYVVWFNDGYNPDLVDLAFISNTKKMKLLKQFNDGAIYGYDK